MTDDWLAPLIEEAVSSGVDRVFVRDMPPSATIQEMVNLIMLHPEVDRMLTLEKIEEKQAE